jgi:hypothetical protein
VVAKTEQNVDDDASVHMNPSTGKGMCLCVLIPIRVLACPLPVMGIGDGYMAWK